MRWFAVKNRTWLLLIGILLVLCLGASICLLLTGQESGSAEVWSDGKLLYTLDLQTDCTLQVDSQYGSNTITVKDGKIAVVHADCPDGYCIARGWCSSGLQIVCLPNRLVIRFTATEQIDGISG